MLVSASNSIITTTNTTSSISTSRRRSSADGSSSSIISGGGSSDQHQGSSSNQDKQPPVLALVRRPSNSGTMREVVNRTTKLSSLQKEALTTTLDQDIQALQIEKKTYYERLEHLTPRTRRKQRFEMRCNLYKVKWDLSATRIQSAFRGYRTRTRLNLRVMLNEWKLEKMAQEDVNRAKALMATSQEVCPSEVLAVLHVALAVHPNNHEALMMKAQALYAQGRYDKAVHCTDLLLARHKDDVPARRLRACALIKKGDLEEAAQELTRALELDEQDSLTYEMRSLLLGRMRRYREALHDINRCLDLQQQGGTMEGRLFLRRAACLGSLQDWHESLVDVRRSMAQRDSCTARRLLGRLYMCMRKWNDGLRELRAGIRMDPQDPLCQRAWEEARIKWNPMPIEYPDSDGEEESKKKKKKKPPVEKQDEVKEIEEKEEEEASTDGGEESQQSLKEGSEEDTATRLIGFKGSTSTSSSSGFIFQEEQASSLLDEGFTDTLVTNSSPTLPPAE